MFKNDQTSYAVRLFGEKVATFCFNHASECSNLIGKWDSFNIFTIFDTFCEIFEMFRNQNV